MNTVLHLGSGRKGKNLAIPDSKVISLDRDGLLEPDLVCHLGREKIDLPDNSVDGALAVHVLEHIGKQGESEEWFFFWEDLYRVLKPGGIVEFEAPLFSSVWAWADPTHCRALSPQSFIFFCQDNYRIPNSAISPYRIACDFVPSDNWQGVPDNDPNLSAIEPISHFRGILTAKKPLIPWWMDP